MPEDLDDIVAFEAEETRKALPLGWVILFVGLIVWGIYYYFAYTPAFSGWSQGQAYEESVAE